MMKDVKITVMKIARYDDLISAYENPIAHACDMRLGQTFVAKEGKKPQGMCDSAWESTKDDLKFLIKNKYILPQKAMLNGKTPMDADNYYVQAGCLRPMDTMAKLLEI